jgi:hypothetical protein
MKNVRMDQVNYVSGGECQITLYDDRGPGYSENTYFDSSGNSVCGDGVNMSDVWTVG